LEPIHWLAIIWCHSMVMQSPEHLNLWKLALHLFVNVVEIYAGRRSFSFGTVRLDGEAVSVTCTKTMRIETPAKWLPSRL